MMVLTSKQLHSFEQKQTNQIREREREAKKSTEKRSTKEFKVHPKRFHVIQYMMNVTTEYDRKRNAGSEPNSLSAFSIHVSSVALCKFIGMPNTLSL